MVQIPLVKTLLQTCVELDEAFYWGGPRVTLGVLESSTPKAMGGRPVLATEQFERAIELSKGAHLMTRVLYARGVGLQTGNRQLFETQLQLVLAADADAVEPLGLVNRLAQRRAARYLTQLDDLFL